MSHDNLVIGIHVCLLVSVPARN